MLWSGCDTFKYSCILTSKASPWRWLDYWPKHVGEKIHHIVHFWLRIDFINLINARNIERIKILQRPYSQTTAVDVTIKSRCITLTSHSLTYWSLLRPPKHRLFWRLIDVTKRKAKACYQTTRNIMYIPIMRPLARISLWNKRSVF